MLLVEALERGDRHGFHHPRQTSAGPPICEHARRCEPPSSAMSSGSSSCRSRPCRGRARSSTPTSRGSRPPGGGSVAAVQLSKLADSVDFFTALGNDEHARLAREELEARGITVHATAIDAPQRSGFTFVDDAGERTITTIGRKLHPRGHDDALPWHELARCDAVYFCAGDADALLHGAARARPRRDRAGARDPQAGVGRARRARLEREGRGRALPAGTARSRAAARRDDVRARSAAGRSRAGRTRPRRFRRIRPTRTARATASRPVSRSRSAPGSRGSRRSTSPRAAAPARWPGPASTRRSVRAAVDRYATCR